MPNQDVTPTVEATQEREIQELTDEQIAAAEDAEYNKVFFGSDEDDKPKGKTKPNQKANTGSEAGESAEHTDDAAGTDTKPSTEEAGNPDEADEQADLDPNADPKPDETPTVKHKLKWKGEEIEVSDEELIALGQKGFDYTANMQQIARFRKNIEAAGIDDNIIDIMARAKAGDKTAYVDLLQMNGIDPTDLIGLEKDENVNHTLQKNENVIVPSEEVAPLIEQIQRNPILQSKLEKAEVDLPQAVIKRIATDVNALYMTVGEVESGSFDRVMPRVNARLATLSDFDREAVLNNPDFFVQIYAEEKQRLGNGGNGVVVQEEPTTVQTTVQPEVVQPTGKPKPNMAAVGIRKPTSVDPQAVIKDAFNNDDEYLKIRQRVMQSR